MKKQRRLWALVLSVVMFCSILTGATCSPLDVVHAESTDTTKKQTTEELATETVTANNSLGDIVLKQTTLNETLLTIQVTDINTVLKDADSIKVNAKMYYGETVTRSIEQTITLKNEQTDYSLDLKDFGKYTIETQYLKDSATVSKSEDVIVGIAAEEYNIAMINATLPVTLFTLSLWDENIRGQEGKAIPTFAIFERLGAWNWNSLPENVYKLPTASDSDYNGVYSDWFNVQTKMQAYIKDLYEISPNARFHLYTGDNCAERILILLVANQIPEEQYDVVLLSDGSGTYSIFNQAFLNDDGTKYEEMLDEWKKIKIKTRENKSFNQEGIKYLFNSPYCLLQNYTAVVAADENVEWWVARTNGTFSINNTDLLNRVIANCTVKNLSSMLKSVQNIGKEEELKELYQFNNEMFSAVNENGKQVMMILGTTVTNESDFKNYARMIMSYYGDTYEYYYKGHPATPTILYPSKQEELDSLGITDVDSSIPAELILFFFPGIYMCGYDSTTFLSVESAQMACGMFNMKKETGLGKTYGELLDFFSSSINSSDKTYGQYCTNQEHSYYLLEFNNTQKYDFAIYDANENTFVYYKNNKRIPTILTLPTAASITLGQSLLDSQLSNGKADVDGVFQWKDSSVKPSLKDSGKTPYVVEFIPTDTEHCEKIEVEITIIVNSKIPHNVVSAVKKGDVRTVDNGIYKVTSTSVKSVSYIGCKKKSVKSVKIPNSIKLDGKTYKVTAIASNALKNKKKLQRVTIGLNVTILGKNAFWGCKNLQKIVINSKKIKTIKKNALKGITKKAVIKTPKSKTKKYKKLFTSKTGYKKTMKIK